MDYKKMYKLYNSKETVLLEDISATATTIKVKDIDFFEESEGYITIGTTNDAENILYQGIDTVNNALVNCLRGRSGTTKKTWQGGESPDVIYHSISAEWGNNIINHINQRINPNLLINPRFDVKQRGVVFTNPTNQYTADRWRCNGVGVVSLEGEGLMKITSGSINVVYVMEEADFNQIENTPCTLTYSKNGVITSTQTMPTNAKVVDLNLTVGDTLNWVKLEQGTSFTGASFRSYADYEVQYISADPMPSRYMTLSTIVASKRVVPKITIMPGNDVTTNNGQIYFSNGDHFYLTPRYSGYRDSKGTSMVYVATPLLPGVLNQETGLVCYVFTDAEIY